MWTPILSEDRVDTDHLGADDGLTAKWKEMPLSVTDEIGEYGEDVFTLKTVYTDIKLDGVTNLLQYPEYSDVSKFRSLLGVLEEKEKILDVISSHTTTEDGINVYIGAEDGSDAMSNSTLIFKNVTVGGTQLAIGVIGPKRMNYQKVMI